MGRDADAENTPSAQKPRRDVAGRMVLLHFDLSFLLNCICGPWRRWRDLLLSVSGQDAECWKNKKSPLKVTEFPFIENDNSANNPFSRLSPPPTPRLRGRRCFSRSATATTASPTLSWLSRGTLSAESPGGTRSGGPWGPAPSPSWRPSWPTAGRCRSACRRSWPPLRAARRG